LLLNGPAGVTCAIEVSSDLIEWKTIAYVVSNSGTVEFVDKETPAQKRFYRARVVDP
jgi:hypothetical protein